MNHIERRTDGSLVVDHGGITRTVIPAHADGVEAFSRSGVSDDAYPNVVADQRLIYGVGASNANEIEQFWVDYLAGKLPPMSIVETDETLIPYINQARWLVDCSYCDSAAGAWDRNPYACCLSCGRRYSVQWQPPSERAEILRILAARPVVNRNWDTRIGETVDDLIRQNILMLGVDVRTAEGLMMAANVVPPNEISDQSVIVEAIEQNLMDPTKDFDMSADRARTLLKRGK